MPAEVAARSACRLCGGGLIEAFEIPRAPGSVQRLLSAHEVAGDGPIKLSVRQCCGCGLVQLDHLLPADFYDDYEMTLTFSPRFRTYLDELAGEFIMRSNLGGRRLAEIGCGDGTFLECFARRGFEVTGVEPSEPYRRSALAKGLTVHPCYIGPTTPVPDGPYDAVVSRQVLEHVPEINGFLAGLRASLVSGGYGLIEVPSLELAIADRRFYDFFPDHANYFSAGTLAFACRRHGLAVSDVVPTMEGEFIAAFVTNAGVEAPAVPRPAPQPEVGLIGAAIATTVAALKDFLDQCRERGQRVAAWGGGGKGVATFAAAGNLDAIAYLVDSDPRKQGRYLPVSHLQVQAPERLRHDQVDCVLLTALAHAPEIEDILRHDLGFDGTLALLGETITVKDMGEAPSPSRQRQ